MKFLNFEGFMKKNQKMIIRTNLIYEEDKYPVYPRGSKIYSDKGFVNKDIGSQGGTHWTCFIIQK